MHDLKLRLMHKMPYNFLSAISTMQQQKPMERGEVGVGNFIGVFKLSTRSSEVFYFMLCFSYFPMPFVAQPVVLSHICKRATPALSFRFSFRFGYSMNVRTCIYGLYMSDGQWLWGHSAGVEVEVYDDGFLLCAFRVFMLRFPACFRTHI